MGYGIYAKAEISKYTNTPVIKISFTDACTQILDRLGIRWDLTKAQKAYNSGLTTQVPVQPSIRLKSRFRRTLSNDKLLLRYEDGIYAK